MRHVPLVILVWMLMATSGRGQGLKLDFEQDAVGFGIFGKVIAPFLLALGPVTGTGHDGRTGHAEYQMLG